MMWNLVLKELIVREANVVTGEPGLRLDLPYIAICGVWQLWMETLIDVSVVDTDASSYMSCAPVAVLRSEDAELNTLLTPVWLINGKSAILEQHTTLEYSSHLLQCMLQFCVQEKQR